MKLHEALKKARQESRYPRIRDFAERVGLSYGGYKKLETGERIPAPPVLESIIKFGELQQDVGDHLRELRMRTHAKRSGLPSIKAVDVDQLVDRLETEFIVVTKSAGMQNVARVAEIFKKRAAVIVRAAVED